MRRLALAAVVASLVLTACSDQSQQTPTEPGPSFKGTPVGFPCSTTGWVSDNTLIAIFPSGRGKTLLSSAQEKINAITLSCQSGKLADAQKKAIYFVDWMFKKFQGQLLIANPPTPITDLLQAVLLGVGLNGSGVSPDMVLVDGGSAVFDPASTFSTDLVTTSGFAALSVPPGSFDLVTLLLAKKLPNNTKLKTPPGQVRDQFPPFYDFDAINANNQHVLNDQQNKARVELCLYDLISYPPGIGIGHNPVFGAPGYPFEILEPDSPFLVECTGDELTSVNPSGLRGLAVSAWHAAKRSMMAVFLPQPLRAATLVIGGSIAGKTGSVSPFGIVDGTAFEFTQTGDPTGQTFTEDNFLTWCFATKGGCWTFPAVRVVNADGSGIGGVLVTVTLDPVGGSSGTLTTGEGGSTRSTDSESGIALFGDLQITAPGTYRLRFSIPGRIGALVSGEFTVEPQGED